MIVIDTKNNLVLRLDSSLKYLKKETIVPIRNAVKYWAERFCEHHGQSAEFEINDQQDYPQQTDGESCGFFVIKAISLILNGFQYDRLHEKVSQNDMSRVRQHLKEVLLTKNLSNIL